MGLKESSEVFVVRAKERVQADPKLALGMSILCPGLGHLYNGEFRKGFFFQLAALNTYALFGLLVLVSSLTPAIKSWAESNHLKINEQLMDSLSASPAASGTAAPFFFVVSLLLIGFVLYCARDAFARAAKPPRLALYHDFYLEMPEAASGAYLAHIICLFVSFILAFFFLIPAPPRTVVTEFEFVAPQTETKPPVVPTKLRSTTASRASGQRIIKSDVAQMLKALAAPLAKAAPQKTETKAPAKASETSKSSESSKSSEPAPSKEPPPVPKVANPTPPSPTPPTPHLNPLPVPPLAFPLKSFNKSNAPVTPAPTAAAVVPNAAAPAPPMPIAVPNAPGNLPAPKLLASSQTPNNNPSNLLSSLANPSKFASQNGPSGPAPAPVSSNNSSDSRDPGKGLTPVAIGRGTDKDKGDGKEKGPKPQAATGRNTSKDDRSGPEAATAMATPRLTSIGPSSIGPGPNPGQNVCREADFGPYMAALQRRIKSRWHPPKAPEASHVKATFVVSKEGNMTRLKLVRSSGLSIADQAALRAIEEAAPFPPLPEFAPDEVTIEFSFDYNVFNR